MKPTKSAPPDSSRSESLPPLWGRARHLIGWQGMTLSVPSDWNPGKVAGNRERGDVRIDDPDGARLEIRWETPKNEVNIEKTVDNFIEGLAKDAKKAKRPFESRGDLNLVSKHKKGKNRLVSFGWTSDTSGAAPNRSRTFARTAALGLRTKTVRPPRALERIGPTPSGIGFEGSTPNIERTMDRTSRSLPNSADLEGRRDVAITVPPAS